MFITVPSGTQWFLIVVLFLLLFGAKRLPDIASSFGESIRRFRESYRGDDRGGGNDRGRGRGGQDSPGDGDVTPEG